MLTNLPREDVLVFNRELAKEIGLEETIILYQIEYWINKNKEANKNFHRGVHWTFNTYEEWQEDNFPFMSVATVRRKINKLEKLNLLFSENEFNKRKGDKTKWYTINYHELNKLLQKIEEQKSTAQFEQSKIENEQTNIQNEQAEIEKARQINNPPAQIENHTAQIEQSHCSKRAEPLSKLSRPLPESTSENSKENSKENLKHMSIIDSKTDEILSLEIFKDLTNVQKNVFAEKIKSFVMKFKLDLNDKNIFDLAEDVCCNCLEQPIKDLGAYVYTALKNRFFDTLLTLKGINIELLNDKQLATYRKDIEHDYIFNVLPALPEVGATLEITYTKKPKVKKTSFQPKWEKPKQPTRTEILPAWFIREDNARRMLKEGHSIEEIVKVTGAYKQDIERYARDYGIKLA